MENEKWPLVRRKFFYLIAFVFILIIYLLIVFIAHPTKVATLYLQGFTAFAQTVIAVSAIWGNEIKALFFGPKLILDLDSPKGQRTYYTEDKTPVRYFHLRVQNKRSGAPAINTQVILLSIVPPNKYDNHKPIRINGRLPFPWKFGQGRPFSIIGPEDYCDLGRLPENGVFELLVEGYNVVRDFLLVGVNQRTTVEIMAIASNGQSNPLTLDISWDGEWPVSDDEVTRHIKIEPRRRNSWLKRKIDC
jgi:hypothetical protein